jgi:hypothetical protein
MEAFARTCEMNVRLYIISAVAIVAAIAGVAGPRFLNPPWVIVSQVVSLVIFSLAFWPLLVAMDRRERQHSKFQGRSGGAPSVGIFLYYLGLITAFVGFSIVLTKIFGRNVEFINTEIFVIGMISSIVGILLVFGGRHLANSKNGEGV